MPEFPKCKLPRWLLATPIPSNDIRKIYSEFPTPERAEQERRKRIAILEKGRSKTSALLAEALSAAPDRQSASVGCCPILARQFQIGFVSAALDHHHAMAVKGIPYTLFDLEEAVATRDLDKVDWRRLHARLRKRIGRILGEGVVVIGMGELEYDASRHRWQPHYHLMIYGAASSRVKELRKKHYRAKRNGPRPMVRSSCGQPATWFSYMSKLIAFGKRADLSSRSRRVRLPGDLSRAYFRYAASRHLTSFILCINCNLARPPEPELTDAEEEYERVTSHLPTPSVAIRMRPANRASRQGAD